MCRGASNTPAICPGRLHRGRVRFGEPFRVRRPNSHADRVRLVVAESQRGSTRTVDLRSGRTNHQLAWPEKGRGNGRERVVIFSCEASPNLYRWVPIQVKPADGSLLISRVKFH